MISTRILLAACLGSALALAGCEKKSETPSGNPAPTPQATDAAAKDTASKAKAAESSVKDIAADAKSEVKKDASAAADALKSGAPNAAEAVASNPAASDAAAKIQQVLDYIKDKKLDLADTTLKQLEANKASLPAAVAAQVDNARKMLNTAKAAASASQPAGTP